ncbi:hypothetical protein HDU97_008353 [Phlyctochytrium planicorne]|nr:hypothetical protein HDU97_008353 [Phlyctochytrium planicorne]
MPTSNRPPPGSALHTLDTLLTTITAISSAITPSPTSAHKSHIFNIPSPKSPSSLHQFHSHPADGSLPVVKLMRRKSNMTVLTINRNLGEVGDGVWAEVVTPLPTSSTDTPFSFDSGIGPSEGSGLTSSDAEEEEVVVVDEEQDLKPKVIRFIHSPAPVKHSIPEAIFIEDEEFDPPARNESLRPSTSRNRTTPSPRPADRFDTISSSTTPTPSLSPSPAPSNLSSANTDPILPAIAVHTTLSAKQEAFSNTLQHPKHYASLKAFAASEHCSENLAFLEQLASVERVRLMRVMTVNVEEISAIPLAKSRALDRFLGVDEAIPIDSLGFDHNTVSSYMNIYMTFVRDEAPLEVNIPDSVKKGISSWVARQQENSRELHDPASMFATAADEVLSMVYRDIFPRFLARNPALNAASGEISSSYSSPRYGEDDLAYSAPAQSQHNRSRAGSFDAPASTKNDGELRGRQRGGSFGGNGKPAGKDRSKSQGRLVNWLTRLTKE